MAYVKTNWQNGASGNTPINATNLNNIENGIETNDIEISMLKNNLMFKAGEEYTYNRVISGSLLTGSKTSLLFTIPLPKFAIGLNASILSGTIYARGINGYLLNGTSITAAKYISIYLTIALAYPAFSSAVNNTPVTIQLDNLKISFASAS